MLSLPVTLISAREKLQKLSRELQTTDKPVFSEKKIGKNNLGSLFAGYQNERRQFENKQLKTMQAVSGK